MAMRERQPGVWELRVRVFAEIVDQYLKLISYGNGGYASQIRLPGFERAEVVADPQRSFGQPIFAHGAASLNTSIHRIAGVK